MLPLRTLSAASWSSRESSRLIYEASNSIRIIAARWFPSTNRRIVIDPARSFGQPVVEKEGVPTSVLARSYKAEQSLKRVARWYDVDVRSVRAAVEFERRLAA